MFNTEYLIYKNLVNPELVEVQRIINTAISVKEPLNTEIINFLNAPSKRIRIVLVLLYLRALGEKISEKHLRFLAALEMVHNASLIHDDIIDNSEIRRGRKSLYAEFGNKLGVISGDYLLSVAMNILCEVNSVDVIKIFSDTLKKMCIGEINQSYNRYKICTIEDYVEKSKNKTGYLFETALVCSLMLCNKNYDIKMAGQFALNFGIAFQIRDDLLNITQADNAKPSLNDIEEGIYNAPVIYAKGVDNVIDGIEKTRILLNNYISSATDMLSLLPDNEYKTALTKISELLKND